jgi:hypothetical protein
MLEKTERNYRRAQRIVDNMKDENGSFGNTPENVALKIKEAEMKYDNEFKKNKKLYSELKRVRDNLEKAKSDLVAPVSEPILPQPKSSKMCIVS